MSTPNFKAKIQELAKKHENKNLPDRISAVIKDLEDDGWTNVQERALGLRGEKAGKGFYVDFRQAKLVDRSPVFDRVRRKAPNATYFVWDGCHKIYIIENEKEAAEAKKSGYGILNIEDDLETAWKDSCNLKFINFWNLDKDAIIPQCDNF